jgi:peptidoglycan endopeptidase LytF
VAPSEIRPGDLVFFRNTYGYGVTHVGIAIGGGQFVSALSDQAGVVVSSLDAPFWRAHFTGARRVTG